MKRDKGIYELDKGINFYSPEYTKVFNKVNATAKKVIQTLGFKEVIAPKLIPYEYTEKLMGTGERFSDEVSNEIFRVKGKRKNYVNVHWQCEPFYWWFSEYFKINPPSPLKVFDDSGYSSRDESNPDNEYRLIHFRRIECVWIGPKEFVNYTQTTLLNELYNALQKNFKLDLKIKRKYDEELKTGEIRVIDIEMKDEEKWTEIAGSHIHGDKFIKILDIPVPEEWYTACCGIGTQRISNFLWKRKLREEVM